MLCQWLTEKSKLQLAWDVDRSTPQKRIEDFVKRSEGLIHEMRHNERVAAIPILKLLAAWASTIHLSMFILAISINGFILMCTFPDDESGAGYHNVQYEPWEVSLIVPILGYIQLLFAFVMLTDHLTSVAPLTVRVIGWWRTSHAPTASTKSSSKDGQSASSSSAGGGVTTSSTTCTDTRARRRA